MDFSGLLFLAFLWFLFNMLAKSRGQDRPRPPTPQPPRRTTGDATQREGSQLEMLFRELERRLDEAARPERTTPARPDRTIPVKPGPRGRPATVSLPQAEEVEERESLEIEPPIMNLDERAEGIVAARIAAAEARSGPLTRADHLAFDARIRQEPADATGVRTPSPEQLRRAMVWREILGPPASLRDPER